MNKPVTLLDFLESTGTTVTAHEIGRRITSLSRDFLVKFENQQIAYPYPLQQQAWFALNLRDKNRQREPVIWFLRFPLDENGYLLQAGRDYFLHRLFEAVTTLKQNPSETSLDQALKDNPHVFKPREDKLAVYHARLSVRLKLEPSRFYTHAVEYFSGKQGWEQWQFVGLQGIADLLERLQDHEADIIRAIPELPPEPLEALCQCMENTEVSHQTSEALYQRFAEENRSAQINNSLVTSLLRGMAQSRSVTIKNDLYSKALECREQDLPERLTAIAARSWEWLKDEKNAGLYLEKLALTTDSKLFNDCLADLLFIPGMRNPLLNVLRNPARSDRLARAFSNMLKPLTG